VSEIAITIRWLGHASFLINAAGRIIYTDPYEGEYSKHADLILVSHSHSDHCDLSKIKKVRKANTILIAPEDCRQKIAGNVNFLKPGDEVEVDGIKVEAVEAYNVKRFRSSGNPYHPKGFGVGYVIMAEDKKIYHAGDTDFISEMQKIGDIDVALLPSGGTYTMDNAEAAEAAITINPKVVVPMHRWDTDPEVFKREVEAKSDIKVVVLKEGQEYQVA